VNRKYTEFCSLHQKLKSNFRGLLFPQSAGYFDARYDDIGRLLDNDLKHEIVEDRRKQL